jgi:hypothetical protein
MAAPVTKSDPPRTEAAQRAGPPFVGERANILVVDDRPTSTWSSTRFSMSSTRISSVNSARRR